ncbi:hypothetical protein VQ7734_02156 [Vibrio quintilis]|uniref:Uncharacterized protein n=1 Tax=Vibrio quintilis TaxID=1117707 RepID=A0A1M7YUN8_9VIBR|nr:hypothetical protein VQ7734_02156 [Vibrio quintilis]
MQILNTDIDFFDKKHCKNFQFPPQTGLLAGLETALLYRLLQDCLRKYNIGNKKYGK